MHMGHTPWKGCEGVTDKVGSWMNRWTGMAGRKDRQLRDGGRVGKSAGDVGKQKWAVGIIV